MAAAVSTTLRHYIHSLPQLQAVGNPQTLNSSHIQRHYERLQYALTIVSCNTDNNIQTLSTKTSTTQGDGKENIIGNNYGMHG